MRQVYNSFQLSVSISQTRSLSYRQAQTCYFPDGYYRAEFCEQGKDSHHCVHSQRADSAEPQNSKHELFSILKITSLMSAVICLVSTNDLTTSECSFFFSPKTLQSRKKNPHNFSIGFLRQVKREAISYLRKFICE